MSPVLRSREGGVAASSPQELGGLLKLWALEAGFDRAGVASVEPSDHGKALLRWLELGRHATMGYLARRVDCRLDNRNLLGWARSALCVALQYGDPHCTENDLWPGVARYARGRDYHDIMGSRLAALGERIESALPGVSSRWYVDTGPILERELAARAGLGAIGKNTNLLHPEGGSYFFIGELFLDLELTPDVEIGDLCGSCTACLDACPTGALPAPYELDSELCISYWSIEHRGNIPVERRQGQGRWLFGCDVCQEVCPWNASERPPSDSELETPPQRRALSLIDLLELSRQDYVERFRGSPMKRAKLEGLKRNAAIAMGNRQDRRYVGALSAALSDEHVTVRRHAAWALGRIGGSSAVSALFGQLSQESVEGVREEIRLALEMSGNPSADAISG